MAEGWIIHNLLKCYFKGIDISCDKPNPSQPVSVSKKLESSTLLSSANRESDMAIRHMNKMVYENHGKLMRAQQASGAQMQYS